MKRLSRRSVLSMGLAIALILALGVATGCASNANSTQSNTTSSSDKSSAVEMVKDMNGDDVLEAGSAKNILTVNSVATQMVLMCGGEDAAATLGQGFQYGDNSLNKKMFPDLNSLKTFTRDDATVENVAAINPSLVLIDVPDTVKTLRDADIPTAFLSVTGPDTLMQAVQLIGDSLGGDAAAKATEYSNYYEGTMDKIGNVSKNLQEADKPRVLYMRDETRAIGANSMPDNWITLTGGVNVGAELNARGGAGSEVTTEAIIAANPDIIVCERPELYTTLTTNAQYADINAVKNGKVFVAPLGTAVWSMGTAEAPLMLYWAASVINPELYSDVNVDAQTKSFFKDFYGYELSNSDLNTIFHR